MIKRRLLCIAAAMTILLCSFTVFAAEGDHSIRARDCIGLDAEYAFLGSSALIENTESVILYETGSDVLMYAYNPDVRIYPASMVKIMTALLAVEQGKLTDVVVVKKDVLDTIPDSAVSVGLQVNELLTLEDLLYCLMVGSANDAAVVIADHIGGDLASFVTMMNQRATQIGCTNTVFTNAHGLHDDDQYSSARDIAKILAVASENETFMEIFSAVYYDVPATNKKGERYLSSGNYIMNRDDVQIYYDSRVTGSRTGTDTNGNRCLATTASANGLNYIAIVTGSKSVYEKDGYTVRVFGGYNETKSLLDLGFNGNGRGQVFYKGQTLMQHPVVNGENDVVLGALSDVFAVIPNDAALTYTYNHRNPEMSAPIKQGEILSTVEVWCNGVCIAETELYAMNAVNVAGTSYTPLDNNKPWYDVVIAVILWILGVIAILALGFFVYKKYGYLILKKLNHRKKQKRNR